MSKSPSESRPLELPPLEAVEEALDLEQKDRDEIPGLYRLNVGRVPGHRVRGFQILLAFALVHNVLVFGEPWWTRLAWAIGVAEFYVLIQYVVLKRFFVRFERFHLGTLFLVADLWVFTLAIWATGATQSWLWPLYLVRVADQMWIGRRRAAAMAFLAAGVYAVMVVLVVAIAGEDVAWSLEALKVLVLGGMSYYLVWTAGLPWNLKEKAHAAKELILRLEDQSIELDEARHRAEMASLAKSTFLARMSHELRTPLNSVVGFTNVLLKGDAFDDKQLDYLTRIRQNGMHLLALINDVLDIARIEAGKVEIHLAEIDAEELVRDTVRQLEGRQLHAGVRISVSFPRKLVPIRADEARLRQVLINLVGNALKFTEKGFVRVEVDADDEGRSRAIRVVDSGIGIGPERMRHIFEAFEQEDGTTARRFGGTGLGLAISRSLCRLMDFDLAVESEVGKGSAFTIDLAPTQPRMLHPEGVPGPNGASIPSA